MPFDSSGFNAGRERQPYLKCIYEEGCFPEECFVSFTNISSTAKENPLLFVEENGSPIFNASGLENHIWVKREDVIPLNDREGLLTLRGLEKIGEGYLVSITDVGDRRISRSYVPKSEIVWR
jgi:hypothetical protein|tara:strand:- start:248 stop:613 length:366 start_codon:yes stop_codon:yes gene_type:complete